MQLLGPGGDFASWCVTAGPKGLALSLIAQSLLCPDFRTFLPQKAKGFQLGFARLLCFHPGLPLTTDLQCKMIFFPKFCCVYSNGNGALGSSARLLLSLPRFPRFLCVTFLLPIVKQLAKPIYLLLL